MIAVVAAFGLLMAGAAAFVLCGTNSEFTECYGIFRSREAAEQAADAARDVGLGTYVDHRSSESAVTFDTGETGSDASEHREAFREIVRREGGTLGHPGGGCVERTPLD